MGLNEKENNIIIEYISTITKRKTMGRGVGLGRRLNGSESFLLLQRSRVQFPEPISGTSQFIVTPAPGGESDALFWPSQAIALKYAHTFIIKI